MNFKILNRTELDQRMKSLALRERELLSEVLLVIKEIDGRRLFLDMGFPNLFTYLVSLGYSEGAAQRRIDAARLLTEIPSLNDKIESGSVNLSQISLVQKALRAAKKQSKNVSTEDKNSLLEEVSHKTYHETQATIARFLDLPILQAEVKSTQKDDSVRVTLTLPKELYEKINRAQELLSHSLPSKELAAYLDFVSDKVIQQKTKLSGITKKRPLEAVAISDQAVGLKSDAVFDSKTMTKAEISPKQISKPKFLNRANSTATSAVNLDCKSKAKAIPASVRKQLYLYQRTCQFTDPVTGRRCQSSWRVQADHRQSRWAGGNHRPENLQLLCQAHNILKYKSEMNTKYLSR